ncbi:hypothetical protein QCD79_33840, partial [Pseudomonas quasicaspiana]|nr:hypothetical protein [Pseudomonas quasicaspiana]
EYYAVDLVKNQDGAFVGVIAICIETGETMYIRAKATVHGFAGFDADRNHTHERAVLVLHQINCVVLVQEGGT